MVRRKYSVKGGVCVFLCLSDEFSATALLSEEQK